MIRLPRKNSTNNLQREIISLLLEMKEAKADYPYELFKPRRDAVLAQIETLKTTAPILQDGDGGQ